jgi:probable rRNA maturation factor
MAINFFSEEIRFELPNKQKRKAWLKQIAGLENFKIVELNFIFCSDEYLHQINLNYLNHDTYTDIITFDNSEKEEKIEGDIFISIDRIKENANKHKQEESEELSRVLSHGLFHLMGYKDKLKSDVEIMRSKEDFAIKLFNTM